MALYNITYELKGADTDYASFYSILRSESAYNQCLRILGSLYQIKVEQNCIIYLNLI